MLRILIIPNNVANSPITLDDFNRGSIANLPTKLRDRVLKKVEELSRRDVSSVEYKENHFILSRKDKNYVVVPCPDFLAGISTTLLIETVQLLHWYLGPHIYGKNPGNLGGQDGCYDCHRTQPSGVPLHRYCSYADCLSHTKWAEIIEGYEPPVDKNAGALGRMMWECLENNKMVSTEGPQADDANKWIQKG